jgi:hypothetical protein
MPYYNKKLQLEDHMDFLRANFFVNEYGHVNLTLHGLYHEVDGRIEDFDIE